MSHTETAGKSLDAEKDSTMSSRIAEAAQEAKHALEDNLSGAQKSLEQIRDDARDAMGDATRKGTEFVRENPGLALAGAVGIGVLLGMALRHKH